MNDTSSDLGWGEVERVLGCARQDGALDGPAVEHLSLTASTIAGRYSRGRRVGTWTQRRDDTGVELGTFTLDGAGTGVELVRDRAGHWRRGRVVRGKRDGPWTHHDRNGGVVATDLWSNGTFVRRDGVVPWDPPMIHPEERQ